MRLQEAFPSKYLKAEDIAFPRTMQIIGARVEEIGPQKDKKMVIYFQGETKGLIVNKTIWGQLGHFIGSDDSDHWAGKRVELYQDLTRNPQGQQVPCIRVRAAQTMAPQGQPRPADDIPTQWGASGQPVTDQTPIPDPAADFPPSRNRPF